MYSLFSRGCCLKSLDLRRFFNSSSPLSWKPTGKLQQTLASEIEKSGTTLHSGLKSTVKLFPAKAGEGRFFVCGDDATGTSIPASIDFVTDTRLCTTLGNRNTAVRMVEHLLSALEATGVDNCRIQLSPASDEIPLLDGSAREWVEAIHTVGLSAAKDNHGHTMDKLAPFLLHPVYLHRNDSFLSGFPSPKLQLTYGINFDHAPAIGCQWVSFVPVDDFSYVKEIASSRTFCIHEEVEQMYKAGFIRGGSTENAIVCSANNGWLNPPLRYQDEPCRHKVLDLIGDLSLLAENGNQGLPVAHIIAYKGGHSLHAEFARRLSGLSEVKTGSHFQS